MNAVPVSKVQTQDRTVNQLQDNIVTAVQAVSQQLNQITIIGEVKLSPLNLDQFQRQSGKNWVPCNGASCVNTTYSKITGNIVVPTIADLTGSHYYIRIN